jgi:hypothetical protein
MGLNALAFAVISFILPAIFSFKIIGYNRAGAFIFLFGFPMGLIGTYFSLLQLFQDAKDDAVP